MLGNKGSDVDGKDSEDKEKDLGDGMKIWIKWKQPN